MATEPIRATAVPPAHVLDLFAVPEDPQPLQGGQGHSFVAGDLVLSPGRDAATCVWLNPVLARLAVELDTRIPRSLRIAMPIPSRDGRWVVDGWGASRHEPDTHPCQDIDVLVATGRLLHARLASAQPSPPDGIRDRTDRWARAERATFDATDATGATGATAAGGAGSKVSQPPGMPLTDVGRLVSDLVSLLDDTDLGTDQLVHADLAGNVLLDARGVPVVIDVAPYWRPALWAEAVCVLDAVLWHSADPSVLAHWKHGARHQAMLRAGLFRLLSDDPAEPELTRYRSLLLDPPGSSGL